MVMKKSNIVFALLGSALILSWLGVSAVAGVSWCLALGAGLYAAIESNLLLGFYGYIYISSGFF